VPLLRPPNELTHWDSIYPEHDFRRYAGLQSSALDPVVRRRWHIRGHRPLRAQLDIRGFLRRRPPGRGHAARGGVRVCARLHLRDKRDAARDRPCRVCAGAEPDAPAERASGGTWRRVYAGLVDAHDGSAGGHDRGVLQCDWREHSDRHAAHRGVSEHIDTIFIFEQAQERWSVGCRGFEGYGGGVPPCCSRRDIFIVESTFRHDSTRTID
jgi:hypothetical protein